MIRMTLILCAAVYLTLAIGGRDDGQLRAGLMQADARPAAETYRYIPVQAALVTPAAAATVTPGATPAPAPEVTAAATLATAFVTADSLNVRRGPSTSEAALDRLSRGEEVSVVRTERGWTQIRLEGNGVEGWVASNYLTAIPLRMAGN